MVKVSIITPAYIDSIEKLEWLAEMVRSVRSQDFEDWELIVIDDASPTRLALEEPDERIRLLRMVYRNGPALCRNTAAALARSEALLALDADDLLAEGALGRMYDAWLASPDKIIYGDLQRLERIAGVYQPGRVYGLPDYDFHKSLDLNGIMPVTAMHSIDCHVKAGGWKAELEAGLEDVEYWLAAGKAGFCGQRIAGVSLLYRRHEGSRSSQLRTGNKRETEMRNLIRTMHADVFNGRYPKMCCGGGKTYSPSVGTASNGGRSSASMAVATTLDKYSSSDKVWVEYTGRRTGSFGITGQFTNITYTIYGPGHKLEVHVNDLPKFRRSGRGADFKIGIPSPAAPALPVEIAATEPEFVAPGPVVAQVERLDKLALGGRA